MRITGRPVSSLAISTTFAETSIDYLVSIVMESQRVPHGTTAGIEDTARRRYVRQQLVVQTAQVKRERIRRELDGVLFVIVRKRVHSRIPASTCESGTAKPFRTRC